ncbi:hypothetical protein MHU86_15536 [Fragilaria crotonensis]|nr:hypothetical protein MHU86_15536 [Fragilaria crotonensis]
MERREARFRDSIPGLPEIIQIDISVQQSLAYLDTMTKEEIWKPPVSSDSDSTHPGHSANQTLGGENAWHRQGRGGSSLASNLSNPSGTTEHFPPLQGKRPAVAAKQKAAASEEATGSTHSAMTPSLASLNIQRYNTLEAQIKKQQDALDQGLRHSAERFTKMEKQLEQLRRLDELESKMLTSMEYHVATNTTLGLLTRQIDTMMKMMTITTQVTQDDAFLKHARAALPSESVRKSKFQHVDTGQEMLDQKECTTSGFTSTQMVSSDITHHSQSPQKKKQKPEKETPNQQHNLPCATNVEGAETEDETMISEGQEMTDFPTTQENMALIEFSSQTNEEARRQPIDTNTTPRVLRQPEFSAATQRTGVYPIFHSRDAPTDLDDQYNKPLDPDGGDPD